MSITARTDLRNVAIIAHVDHGKTTLVDALLKQGGIFRENEKVEERILDTGDQERARGITILSKNTAIPFEGVRLNIIDTPGHADFGGEVERVLRMADGAILVVDAFEGPMPQTEFVLRKALEAGLRVLVVVNKIDRTSARPDEVVDEVFDLFAELGASDEQLDFPVVYASAKERYAGSDEQVRGGDMRPLLECILREVPAPHGDPDAPLQLQVTTLDSDNYVGRVAVGRIVQGSVTVGDPVAVAKRDGSIERVTAAQIFLFEGLRRTEAVRVRAGDIVAVTGLGDIQIGETVTDPESPAPLPLLEIEQPTLTMRFSVNDSPFAGKEGKFVTSRHLSARLLRETESDVALRVDETESPDTLQVSGRGELHLGVLIENMRQEGYELHVSKPEPIVRRDRSGELQEPFESVVIEAPEAYVGAVMERLGPRKAEVRDVVPLGGERVRIRAHVPARGLIGFRTEFLTETKGYGLFHHVFHHYGPYRGEIRNRATGALVASEDGETTAFALFQAQARGTLFVGPGERVYAGQVIGENSRPQDLDINVCKQKRLTNMRAAGSDVAPRLEPPRAMDLDKALEFIGEDELVEVTPKAVRIRKAVLDAKARHRAAKRGAEGSV